jgi:type I restriction enzyme S subunit
VSAVLADAPAVTRTVPLSEAVEFNPKPQRGSIAEDLEVSFVPMAAVEAGSGRVNPAQSRPYADVKKGFTYFCDGDVLFAKITPCMENGKMAVAHGLRNGIGFGSTEFHVLRPRGGVDARYVYYFVSSARFRREAAHHMTGAVGQKRVPLSFLQQSDVPLPPITEQRRIVAEIEKQFSRLDEAVANLQRVKANLAHYRGAVVSEAVGGAPGEPRQSVSLGSIAAKITSGSRDWSAYYGRGESIFILAQNVRPFAPDFSTLQRVEPPPRDPARTRSRIQRGDLLVTIVGANTGQACMVEALPGEAFVCQSVALIRPAAPETAPYLNLWMNSPGHGQKYFDECMYGQGRPHLGFEQLAAAPISLPPLDEQHRIVAEVDRRLSIVREVEAEVDANLKRAQVLRQAVLAKAFSAPG